MTHVQMWEELLPPRLFHPRSLASFDGLTA
jgi:hypothetical protein